MLSFIQFKLQIPTSFPKIYIPNESDVDKKEDFSTTLECEDQ